MDFFFKSFSDSKRFFFFDNNFFSEVLRAIFLGGGDFQVARVSTNDRRQKIAPILISDFSICKGKFPFLPSVSSLAIKKIVHFRFHE